MCLTDRMHCAPWGLHGGHAGFGNRVTVTLDGREVTDVQNSKVRQQRLKPGDCLNLRAGGGGGFGPPQERDAARVANDVKQGYISAQSARDNYRVSVTADYKVNESETRKLRSTA